MRGGTMLVVSTVMAGCLDPNDKFMDPTEKPDGSTSMAPTTSDGPGSGTTDGETTAMPTMPTMPTMSTPPTMDTDGGPVCGNGVMEAGEACDDGDDDDTNACTNACNAATCGDGIAWAGMEPCDDGNGEDDDDCLNICKYASCGDGVTHAVKEECDDGNDSLTDGCVMCKTATCGDGFVEFGVEACDDGDGDDGDGCESLCVMTELNVFVTSTTYTGMLGGLIGAAVKCNDAAMAAELPGPIKYKAWLSDNMHPAATEIFHYPDLGKYVRPDGVLVAENWMKLTSGDLQAPINVTEYGGPAPPSAPAQCGLTTLAYTNTTTNGSLNVPMYDCNQWGKLSGPAAFGNYEATNELWTDACEQMPMATCATMAPIYCIQEPLL